MAIGETIFDICYLAAVITLGVLMVRSRPWRLFGLMAIILGAGDAFHLLPRVFALCTDGLSQHVYALGVGKFVTSITMTVFYVLLYYFWRQRYGITKKSGLTAAVWLLAAARIVLCLFPQNGWTGAAQPLSWAIARNIPFAILGGLIVVLFFRSAREDRAFRFMWLAIVLSFGFYLPVVLFAETVPAVGALMLPKTCAYVWAVLMGYREYRRMQALSKAR